MLLLTSLHIDFHKIWQRKAPFGHDAVKRSGGLHMVLVWRKVLAVLTPNLPVVRVAAWHLIVLVEPHDPAIHVAQAAIMAQVALVQELGRLECVE